MPNLKIYVDESIGSAGAERVAAALPPLRELLCAGLKVDASVCQFAVISFRGMAGQAEVSVEMQILPRPERTRDTIVAACSQVRELLAAATGARTAVRATALDPLSYVVIR